MKWLILTIVIIIIISYVIGYRYRLPESNKTGYYATEVSPKPMPNQPTPVYSELTVAEKERLDKQRQIVLEALTKNYNISTLSGNIDDLTLLQKLLDDEVFSPDQTIELQSMGIVFGDVLIAELGLQWMMITDVYGTDPTVMIPGTSCNFNVLTVISKRIEQGEDVDVTAIFNIFEAECKRLSKIKS